ncbi:MAG: hypothetical protein PHV20_03050 [Bacteroidales bacterium]|nr:hypothetical protein [Bacteroidales bacterium]
MKKRFTLKENVKHRVPNRKNQENPTQTTLNFLQQFARVYEVEKCKNDSIVEFYLN